MTGRREKQRRQMIEAGLEKPFRQPETKRSPLLRCRKCGELYTIPNVTKHLEKCQPLGAKCPHCGVNVLPKDFISHIKNCVAINVDNKPLPLPLPKVELK